MLARACLNRSCPPNPKKHDRPKHLFQAIGIERGVYLAAEPDLGRRNSARPSSRTAARKLRVTRKLRATLQIPGNPADSGQFSKVLVSGWLRKSAGG